MDRRRILMIFGGAWISAALLTWLLYTNTAAPKAAKMVQVTAAARDMAAGTPLKKADLKLVASPEKDLSKLALLDPAAAYGKVLLFPVNANDIITTSKLSSATGAEGLAATIEPGKRAMSVPVSDMTGAGGLIQPRSHVDVLFTRTGSMREAVTATILQDVIVLSMGKLTETAAAGSPIPSTANRSATTNQAATLLVTPEQAQKLELARNQGKISLALRNPLDRTYAEETSAATAATLNPMLATGIRMGRPGIAGVPNVRDNRVWNELTGFETPPPPKPKEKVEEKKEPPKPRVVVDVYRGDKHVQEIFQ